MLHLSTGLAGLFAASLVVGAAQLVPDDSSAGAASARAPVSIALAVNRSAKADRQLVVRVPRGSLTLSFQLSDLKDTSIVMRLPHAPAKSNVNRKLNVACE